MLLRFVVGSEHFQYRVLPFGIATAPRAFTKVFAMVPAHARCLGLIVFLFLNDQLLAAKSCQEPHVSTIMCQLSSLGININTEKSVLSPTWSLDFIGATLDSITARMYLHTDRFPTMNNIIAHIPNKPQVPVRTCLFLLGHMVSCTHISPFARLHLCCLQAWLQLVDSLNYHPMSFIITVPAKVVSSLLWWMNPQQVCMGVPFFLSSPDGTITIDTSLFGWGAHMDTPTTQGSWMP